MSVVKKCFKLLQLRQHFDKGIPEREVIAYLKSWNSKLKQDEYGNLYLINPGTPLLNAHMDTVQSEQCVKNLRSLRLKNWIISAKDAVIWGDDKCWIAIAMEIYEKLWNKVSLLFTRQEETGLNWAREFVTHHSDLLSECKYCLTLDRRGAWDIIGYQNQYCSKEFEDEIYRLTKEFWFKPTRGLSSDAAKIWTIINAVNLSVGYYNPHTKTEYIKCDELVNACEAVMYIVQHLTNNFPIYTAPKFERGSWREKYNWWWNYKKPLADDDDDDEYDRVWWVRKRKEVNLKTKDLWKHMQIKNWQLIVKKDLYFQDEADQDNWVVLYEGKYNITDFEWY